MCRRTMCECLRLLVFFVCVLCGLVGTALMIAADAVLAWADCEVLEVVDVTAVRPAKDGIGMCVAEFAYFEQELHGTLTTTCPQNQTGTVAVCYPLSHPERYTAAVLASGLDVVPRSHTLALLSVGVALLTVSILAVLIVTSSECVHHRTKKSRQDGDVADV